MAQENFKVISYQEAIKLKEDRAAVFIKTIPSNNGQVFALIDSSYLVITLNPYSSALLAVCEA